MIFAKFTRKGVILEPFSQGFGNIFTGLQNLMKVVFKYAKGSEHDFLFKEEGLAEALLQTVQTCFLQHYDTVLSLTKKRVNQKVEINNEDALFDLIIYALGCIKLVT